MFYRPKYTTQPVQTANSNTIDISDIDPTQQIANYFICPTHKLTKERCCDAIQLSKYPMPILIRDQYMAFFVPPVKILGKNNFSFLSAFVKQFHVSTKANTPNQYKQLVGKYDKFLRNSSFRGGYMIQQISGKTSFFRLQCLGKYKQI